MYVFKIKLASKSTFQRLEFELDLQWKTLIYFLIYNLGTTFTVKRFNTSSTIPHWTWGGHPIRFHFYESLWECQAICQMKVLYLKFLDAGIQDVSTSISIVHDLTEKLSNHYWWWWWWWWWWKWQTYISTRS